MLKDLLEICTEPYSKVDFSSSPNWYKVPNEILPEIKAELLVLGAEVRHKNAKYYLHTSTLVYLILSTANGNTWLQDGSYYVNKPNLRNYLKSTGEIK